MGGGSSGSRSLNISFLRGLRDAICNFILSFGGSEVDKVSVSETISIGSGAGFIRLEFLLFSKDSDTVSLAFPDTES